MDDFHKNGALKEHMCIPNQNMLTQCTRALFAAHIMVLKQRLPVAELTELTQALEKVRTVLVEDYVYRRQR